MASHAGERAPREEDKVGDLGKLCAEGCGGCFASTYLFERSRNRMVWLWQHDDATAIVPSSRPLTITRYHTMQTRGTEFATPWPHNPDCQSRYRHGRWHTGSTVERLCARASTWTGQRAQLARRRCLRPGMLLRHGWEAFGGIPLRGHPGHLSRLITGPLAHRFNARPVIIAGAVISGIGAMLSFFPNSIATMTVTLGAIHAIGAGMVFVVSPTIISEHFVKHKGLAMGINFTGVTMGTFVFPKAFGVSNQDVCLFPRTPKWRNAPADARASQASSKGDNKQGTLRHGLTVFKHPIFYLVMYSFIVHSFGFECYISLFVDFAADRGVAVSSAVTMVSMGAIA
ncbi:hypothetical protein MTO96_026488 [Rhipicephalus appendiculatus]